MTSEKPWSRSGPAHIRPQIATSWAGDRFQFSSEHRSRRAREAQARSVSASGLRPGPRDPSDCKTEQCEPRSRLRDFEVRVSGGADAIEASELPGGSRWLEFRKFSDARGALTPFEQLRDVPFEIRRIFVFYDVPVGESRGSHAHRTLEQVLVATSGSFEVILDDGSSKESVVCERPWRGLYVPPLVWSSQINFAGGTVGLAVTSAPFDERDYIRDYGEFRRLAAR